MGRKDVVFHIGACFRAACNHPFLVVMLCFLAFLYTSFPYLFSLLVSAFPVIFCTGVLLGVLLSYSQPIAPQIQRGEVEIDKRVSIGSPSCNGKHEVEENDQAESSSPDASVVDIVPMLDELHPLLDETVNLSRDDSDEEHFSRDSGTESSEQTELQAEDDEETRGDKDGLSKSAFKWTEEDQKNVMEVGSSELERNQLLERVMERRKSRKCLSMVAVNEFLSSQSYIPPIATRRHNPFDHLPDTYEQGLPPIPGSAPSLLRPRQNPFDIPYNLNEENSQLDFLGFQHKDPFFQRSESFTAGPSFFALNKQEKQDAGYESYFFTEQMAPTPKQTSVYTQSNGLTHSVGDLKDKNVIKEDIEEKKPVVVSNGSQSSEEDEFLESGMGGLKNILVDEIVMKKEGAEDHRAVKGTPPSELETLHSSASSSASSEASERIFVENKVEKQPSLDGSELSISSPLVEEGRRKEPVYDSSPPHIRRNLSSSSIVPDLHEPWFPHIQVKRTVSFAEGVIIMGSNRETEMSIPVVKEMLGRPAISQPVNNADES